MALWLFYFLFLTLYFFPPFRIKGIKSIKNNLEEQISNLNYKFFWIIGGMFVSYVIIRDSIIFISKIEHYKRFFILAESYILGGAMFLTDGICRLIFTAKSKEKMSLFISLGEILVGIGSIISSYAIRLYSNLLHAIVIICETIGGIFLVSALGTHIREHKTLKNRLKLLN